LSRFTTGVRDTELVAGAARAGICVQALSRFAMVDRGDNALGLGLTNFPAEQAVAKCEALRRALADEIGWYQMPPSTSRARIA